MARLSKSAFSLAEILIVTAIIGVVVSIAVVNYTRAIVRSRVAVCITNLKQISGAVDRWALENSIPNGTQPDEDAVYGYINGEKPHCPAGGVYTFESIGNNPVVRCSKESEGHTLE